MVPGEIFISETAEGAVTNMTYKPKPPTLLISWLEVEAFVVNERYERAITVSFNTIEAWKAYISKKKNSIRIRIFGPDKPQDFKYKRKPIKTAYIELDTSVGDALFKTFALMQQLIYKAHPIPKNWKPPYDPCGDDEYVPPPYPKIVWKFKWAGIG